MTKTLTIGRVARQASVGVETVRFYERQGLIDSPPRRSSGYRIYPTEAIARIRFIRRAKELGFSLREIGELMELRLDPSSRCGDVKRRAEQKVPDIEEKIRTLQRMKKSLHHLISACDEQRPTSECPILEALAGEEEKS